MSSHTFSRLLIPVLFACLLFPASAHALPGDLDGSGRVDGFDLILFGLANGSSEGDSRWNSDADLDANGTIDEADLDILSIHFGDNGISFGLWIGDMLSGAERVVKLSAAGNVLKRAGNFTDPVSVSSVMKDGSVWIADSTQDKVVNLNGFDGSPMVTVYGVDPLAVSVNAQDGSLWVADYANNRVIHLLATVARDYTQYTIGTDSGSHRIIHGFNRPRSVSVNPNSGVVWVADTNNNRIVRLAAGTPDNYNVTTDTGYHTFKTGFSAPYDVSVNSSDGTVWVADRGNNQVVKLSATGTTEIVRVGGFLSPQDVDANYMDGSVYIADTGNDQVVRLDSNGALVFRTGGFNDPYAVAVNPLDGACWVADYLNNQVVKLSPKGNELIGVNGLYRPRALSVMPDQVTASKYPIATATLSSNLVGVGDAVTFSGAGSDPDGEIVRYEWDFEGDGIFDFVSETTGVTTHAFSSVGVYNPVFRVTDDTWLTATDFSRIVRVGSLSASASGNPTSGPAPLLVNFSGTFFDPLDGKVDTYQWDFDGDSSFDSYSESTPVTTHTYSEAGEYTATFKVTDGPFTAVDTILISVSFNPPQATAGASPRRGSEPLSVSFTGSGTDADGSVVLYEWDFDGDGTFDWSSLSGGNTPFVYTTEGSYTARLRVTDNDGLTDEKSVSIEVTPPPPVAKASAENTEGYAPLVVSLSAEGSSAPAGSLVLYEWNFDRQCTEQSVFSDDVEAGTVEWLADEPWAVTSTAAHSGTHAWTDSPEGNYADNANVSLTSTSISLSDLYPPAALTFWHRYQTQQSYDLCRVELSTDGGVTWSQVASYSGSLATWTQVQIDIGSFVPSSDFRVRFRLTSNAATVADGWSIDDVAVSGCKLDWVTAPGGTMTYTFTEEGSHTATLRVTDNRDSTTMDTLELYVTPSNLPTATSNADPLTGTVPLPVNFSGTGTDPDGSIVNYSWNFGEEYVWVADTSHNQVVRVYQDGSGELVRKSGFNAPQWIESNSSDGTTWVADTSNHRVVLLSADGRVELKSVGGFSSPNSLSIDPADASVWVTHYYGLVKLLPDVPDGYSIQTMSGSHLTVTGFNTSASVSVNPTDGTVWVADRYNDRVVRMSAGVPDGYNLATDSGSHSVVTGFDDPLSVSVNAVDGTVWVADYYHHQVAKFSSDGASELARVSGFSYPQGVSVDSQAGVVWVADTNNNRVVRLSVDLPEGFNANYTKITPEDSGNNNRAYLIGNTTPSSGRLGGGMALDGSGDYLLILSDPALDVQSFTVEAWVKGTNVTDRALFMRGNASGGNELYLGFDNNTTLEVILDHGSSVFFTNAGSPVNFTDGSWHHVALVYDAAIGELRSYVDGAPYGSPVSVSVTLDFDGSHALIGADFDSFNGTLGNYLSGEIDEVRLWNVVRAEADISAYSATELGPQAGLVGYWKLNSLSEPISRIAAGFNRPLNVSANLSDGGAWVADYQNHQVVRLSREGTELARLGGFSYPRAVTVTSTGEANRYSSTESGNTAHEYAYPGLYHAVFTVIDNDGNTDSRSLNIRVFGIPQVSADSNVEAGSAPLEIFFDGTVTDLNARIVKFQWDFEGDGIYDYESDTTPRTRHVYATHGIYTAVLAAVSDLGYTNTHTVEITVNPTPPEVTADAVPVEGDAPLTVRFRGSVTDPDGAIATYQWDAEGDGTFEFSSPDAINYTHTFANPGTYTATVKVTDDSGLTDTDFVVITVRDAGSPAALLYATPTRGVTPLESCFYLHGIDRDGTIETYRFDFEGDGTYELSSGSMDSPLTPTAFGDRMESGEAYWAAESPWARVDYAYFSKSFSWTDSPDGNYGDSADASLTSNTIDLSRATAPRLIFWHRYDFKSSDYGRVEISGNGGTSWTLIGSYSNGSLFEWTKQEYDLSSYAGNAQVKIRFRVTSNASETADGWYIDDVWVGDCVSHTYENHGTYRPVLEVTDSDGKKTTTSQTLTVLADENQRFVWIADRGNNRVLKFSDDGTNLATIVGFYYPRTVEVDPASGDVWVSDTSNDRVVKLSADVPDGHDLRIFFTPDETANGGDGRLYGNAALGAGKWNNGIVLDGSGDYVEIPDSQVFRMDSWTMEAWIKPETLSGVRTIVGKVGQSKDFALVLNGDKIGVLVYAGARQYLTTTEAATAGQWYHVAAVYDGSTTTLRLYVDGSFIGESVVAVNTSNTDPLRIGSSYCCGEYFHGTIDEVRIWNLARSESEIVANKDSELSNPQSEAGLVGYWKLDSLPTPYHGITTGFDDPYGLSVDTSDGSVWVASRNQNQVVKLSSEGAVLARVGGFSYPLSVEADAANGHVWVSDSGKGRIVRLPVDVPDGYDTNASAMAEDGTANNNSGFLFGNAVATEGRLSGAIRFDGYGDYVLILGSPSLDVDSFTIEAWIKTTTTSGTPAIFMRGNDTGGNEIFFGFADNTTLRVHLDDGPAMDMSGAVNFADNAWHHVALVYDAGTGEVVSYVDGALYGSGNTGPASLDFGRSHALIGADFDAFNGSLGNYFYGSVDDVRLWNVARAEADVAAYTATELSGSEPGLVGYWKLDAASSSPFHLAIGGFNSPNGLCLDRDGGVWVADYNNDRVVKLATDGTVVYTVATFDDPIAVSVNRSDGSIWVADYTGSQLTKLRADAVETVRKGGFLNPQGVDVNQADGTVWVADKGHKQMVKLAPDGTELSRTGGFNEPLSVSVDPALRNLIQPPVPAVNAGPTTGDAPLAVGFTGTGTDDGAIVAYDWDFDGDGTFDFSSSSDPGLITHTYSAPGTYNPVFRLTDNDGMMSYAASLTIYVGPLTASCSASPAEGNAPLNVTLNGSVNGVKPGGRIMAYEWDFEGDGIFDYQSAVRPRTTHSYPKGGTYSAVLRVTDDLGNQAHASTPVVVRSQGPLAYNSASPTTGNAPLTVNLNGSGSDPDGSIVLYEWDYDGDGIYDWFSGTTANTLFSYAEAGRYTATIRVTDNDGLTGTALRVITVNDRAAPPTVSVSADATEGLAPLTVHFTGTAGDPDDGIITLYAWDFAGSGQYAYTSTTGGDATHTYDAPGIYRATLQVTDADGLTATDGVLVTVKSPGTPSAAANAAPTTGETSLTVDFGATGSLDMDGEIVRYEWTFGDPVAWIADTGHNRVERMVSFLRDKTLTGFNYPFRLAVDQRDGTVWVSDQNNDQVVKLRPDGNGEILRVGGVDGPQGLSVDPADGSLWVADYYHHQVVKVGPLGAELHRVEGFRYPMSVAVDPDDGSVWVTDTSNNQVVKLDSEGVETARISGFYYPSWVSVNPNDGSAWVADRNNSRVVKLGGATPDGYHLNVKRVTEDTKSGTLELLFGDAAPYTGTLGGGVTLDGYADYILIPRKPALDVQSFTLEAWVRTSTTYGAPAIFMRGNGTGGNEIFFGFANNTTLRVHLDDSEAMDMSGAVNFADDTWHHVAMVYDSGAAEIRCYADGVLYGSVDSVTADLDFGGSHALIGADFDTFNGGLGNYLNGRIDEVRLWNVARSEADISAYKGTELTGTEAGLVGYWRFNVVEDTPYHNIVTGFSQPYCTAVNPLDDTVWVCDYNNDRMVRISGDGSRVLASVGGFDGPHEAFVNPLDGTVWVADQYHGQVVVLAPDGREIRRLGGYSQPTSVVVYNPSENRFSSDTGGDAVHTYTRTGEYVATLKVTDNDGRTDTAHVTIRAGSFPESLPVAYPTTGPAPLKVRFSANGYSPSGTIEYYRWNFGDGKTWETRISENYENTYANAGTYTATQTVVDNQGLTDVKSVTITVLLPGTAPTAEATANPLEGVGPLQVNFTGLGKDSNGFISHYEWDFDGDGTYDHGPGPTGVTSFTYTEAGVYAAVLRVTDNDGEQGTATVEIHVKEIGAPTASASGSPTSGNAALTVNFTGSGTDDGSIVLYEWDFDGNGVFDYTSSATGNTTHTYVTAGSFDAVFRVTDNEGKQDTARVNIHVSAGISASLSADMFDPIQGQSVAVNSALTAPATVTLLIKDKTGNVVRTLVEKASRTTGYYSDLWDGRNQAGEVVPSGVYLYVIEYEMGGQKYLYDVTNNVDSSRYTPSVVYPPSFNPFSSETNFFRYTLTQKSEITVYVAPFTSGAGERVRTLLLRYPQKAGSYVQVWDGTDDFGNLVAEGNYVIAVMAWRLPDNAVIVRKEPMISDLLVTPTYFNPAGLPYDENTTADFMYTLSKTAGVTARIFDSDNFAVRTIVMNEVPAGTGNEITWDGKNDLGFYVAPGAYRLRLVATDSLGNTSLAANSLLMVFY